MARGAKHLLIVSRSATTHPNATKLNAHAEAIGCKVYLRNCDVTNDSSLVDLLAECSRTLPPIRGLVNAAMVLQDTVFEHMTYEQCMLMIKVYCFHTVLIHRANANACLHRERRCSIKDRHKPKPSQTSTRGLNFLCNASIGVGKSHTPLLHSLLQLWML